MSTLYVPPLMSLVLLYNILLNEYSILSIIPLIFSICVYNAINFDIISNFLGLYTKFLSININNIHEKFITKKLIIKFEFAHQKNINA